MEQTIVISMEKDEATVVTERIRDNLNDVRRDLLYMFENNGWLALGYESWHQYLTHEFTHHHSYLRRQTNAALLESQLAEDGTLIGAHIESHMRPLIEILGDDIDRQLAYWEVQSRTDSPVARDYELVAKEMALLASPFVILKSRFSGGYIGIVDAYAIYRFARYYTFQDDNEFITIASNCNDPQLVKDLAKLYESNTDTWTEVLVSGCIPSYDGPINLGRATSSNLRAWLDVSSAEHRAAAMEQNKDYYIKRKEIVDTIIGMLLDSRHLLYIPEEQTDALFRQVDMLAELDKKGGDE